ncbi:acetyl-CoA synthetase-like protein [Cylindrobasidium torrendii FP15055 ss-10]|uniref:Acetyl-CoA synthetase-like protein n=1 Tax=Cylindrobasidium torrendii FP15055 ss-10 TaxID=1314674 RepID=A0A0D7BRD2_9AGAR|nr:acetyl-CoA synthetase-like protein [Cylindrobasidium torrendii FP15055 ss-10]
MPPHLHAAIPGEADPANEKLALDWLFENASNRPDAIAHEIYATLQEPPLMLTYGELNRKSNALAHWLVSKGIEVEDKVPLCSNRSQYFYIAMAAILKAGGCYVSIDPELPLERKTFIADDSGAKLVFTAAEDAPTFGDRAVLLSESLLADALTSFGGEDVCHATLDSLAYLLYTSGTTGNPKGCLLEHRGLYWAMLSFCALPKPVTNPDTDKRLALASTAFDVHISEIVQSWCLGSRLVSAPRFELLTQLRKHVVDIGITHMGMVPSMIEALLQKPDGLPLKYLVSGGEKITDSLLEKWSNREGLVLANFYGPTEATIGCTSRRVGLYDRKENIGRAFPSCSAFVVDRNLDIVPIGCPGELIARHSSIHGALPLTLQGYHGLPEATAKAFIDFPNPGDRAYRTGDLVRMMADGSIEIMGRIDLQVKYRGVRIETEGVSSILVSASEASSIVASTFITTHPAVANELLVSVVAPRESTVSIETRRTTVPDLLHTDDAKALIRTLKKAVDAKLPVYQRPAYILPVAFMPLSFNGKTDNKVLAHLVRNLDMGTLLEVQGGKA